MTLVVVDPAVCPACTSPTATVTIDEPAIVRHGGYGATRTTTVAFCSDCGWSLVRNVTETNPRRTCTD